MCEQACDPLNHPPLLQRSRASSPGWEGGSRGMGHWAVGGRCEGRQGGSKAGSGLRLARGGAGGVGGWGPGAGVVLLRELEGIPEGEAAQVPPF